ncbi:MAG: DUF4013 domain-containing protein [Planctomycetes bacterium]|nr:DUF4013 domain-containing protein [Planctomycetota bacterium]
MTLHPHVAGLLVVLDPRWRRKMFVGGLVLMIPVVGWPAVLGYRSRFVRHMFTDTPELLPPWKGHFWSYVLGGVRAMAVIFGYLSPVYALLAWTLLERGWCPEVQWAWLALACFLFPLFAPLSLPIALIALAFSAEHWLSFTEASAFFVAFAALIYLVPAGFLEVSRTGRYMSAFALWRSLPFAWRERRAYIAAWFYSILQSLFGHFTLPFAPWGVMWCYIGIVSLFNEVLVQANEAPGQGWLQRAIADPRFDGRGRRGRFTVLDNAGERVSVLDVGPFSVPLPRLFDR